MLFPAPGVTGDRRSVGVAFANYLHPLGLARTVNSQFCLARRFGTGLVGVALSHASVSAVFLLPETLLCAAFGHKFVKRVNAFACFVTNLLTGVATRKFNFASFSARKSLAVAKLIRFKFLAAVAETSDSLETGRTVSGVTLHGAGVVARQLLAAGFVARRGRHSTLDWRVEFGRAARAEKGLRANPLAGFAWICVAEVAAGVFSAGKHFVAGLHAKMAALGV